MKTSRIAALLAAAAFSAAACAQPAPTPNRGGGAATKPQPATAAKTAPTPQNADRAKRVNADAIKTADDLLTALETADEGLETFAADIRFVRTFGALEGNETHERRGKIYYITTPRRQFRVDFDKAYIDGVLRDEVEQYIFDGRRLIERHPAEKQQIERSLSDDGRDIDPLAVGEGPFPVPIGQKKAEMLRRFTAELLKPEEGWDPKTKFPPTLSNTFQLRLIPKPGTDEAKQFKDIRLWYLRDTLLPRLARTTEPEGAGVEVMLINQKLNEPVPAGIFDAALPSGWPPPQLIELRKETDDSTNANR